MYIKYINVSRKGGGGIIFCGLTTMRDSGKKKLFGYLAIPFAFNVRESMTVGRCGHTGVPPNISYLEVLRSFFFSFHPWRCLRFYFVFRRERVFGRPGSFPSSTILVEFRFVHTISYILRAAVMIQLVPP